MGVLNRQTRHALGELEDDEFDAFLDDVAEKGLQEACRSRIWTMGATLNWIAADEKRSALYARALMIRAEVAVHETLEIADGAQPETAGVAKGRVGARQWAAERWNRERYGQRVAVDKGGVVGLDAGLVGLAGELLARLVNPRAAPARLEKDIGGGSAMDAPVERSVAQTGGGLELEADAGESGREREPSGNPPPEKSPRRSVSFEPI